MSVVLLVMIVRLLFFMERKLFCVFVSILVLFDWVMWIWFLVRIVRIGLCLFMKLILFLMVLVIMRFVFFV